MSNGNGTGTQEQIQEVVTDTVSQAIRGNAKPAKNIGLALFPFTPVPFTGSEAMYSWGRLIVYGGLAVALHKRSKPLSYIFAGAAGVSAMTSLAAKSWS